MTDSGGEWDCIGVDLVLGARRLLERCDLEARNNNVQQLKERNRGHRADDASIDRGDHLVGFECPTLAQTLL